MRIAHFFVDRPIFATVLAIITVLLGTIAYVQMPVAQYPEVVPPTIVVRASYPGANAETVASTVATPLEQEINGVENMLYMSSFSTSDGQMSLTVTFELGTDLDDAQVLVQNRVATAQPRLPEEVRRLGVTTRKSSPDLMMVVHLLSPDNTFDQLYISNYALLRIRDVLARLDGVGNVTVFGLREYSLRVWLDPDRMAVYGLTAGEVVEALREQNVQVSGGILGQPPNPGSNAFQYVVNTQGRFESVEQFEDVIIKRTNEGKFARLRDVARVELGAKDYVTNSYLNGKPAVAVAIFQRPQTNALQAAQDIKTTMQRLSADFPKGLEHRIIYNPVEFIQESVDAVLVTIFEAALLVVFVVLLFLQSWRTAIIPIIAIPVSLIGTFAVMAAFGFSINNLTLFGLVLAIGIVVDDAIVVVENIERLIAEGKSPKEAAHLTMDEVGGAVIAIALVLCAVFIPTAFIPGISGQFYQQFALTITAATVISAFNSITLSPALGALLLKPHHERSKGDSPGAFGLLLRIGAGFNRWFERLSNRYGRTVMLTMRRSALMLALYGGLLAMTGVMATTTPTGFIPQQDQGYAIVVVQLPQGAALARTDEVVKRATTIIKDTPGVDHAVAFAGFSGATFTNASNAAAIFARFAPFSKRLSEGQDIQTVIGSLQQNLGVIQDAFIMVIAPPPVRGLGNSGGFKMQVQDLGGVGIASLYGSAYGLIDQTRSNPALQGVFSTFNASSPQIFLEIDRTKAQMLGVPLKDVFETLQIYLGSSYVNDFNLFGRVYQVTAQADQQFRVEPQDISRLKTLSDSGALVPLGTLVRAVPTTGTDLVQRYNMFPSIPINGSAGPGASSGDALNAMEDLARSHLPAGLGFEWTELAYQQKNTGNQAVWIFALSVFFVFLVLAALYESWALPLAIILIVPLCILFALLGVSLRGMENNILTQIGLVVLIGLAAKNAILIVEFARQHEEEGQPLSEALLQACQQRLRPILMTSFAFILGVLPMAIATGPGAEMRRSIGTAVFSGMAGITFAGLLLTPVFYFVIRRLTRRWHTPAPH